MKEQPTTIKTNIYLPTPLHAQLQALARLERRSLNSQIVWLLEQALAAREKGSKDATG